MSQEYQMLGFCLGVTLIFALMYGKLIWSMFRSFYYSMFTTVYCPICGHPMPKEKGGSFVLAFIDYDCPDGHYEWHFDCGLWEVRVGSQKFSFWDGDSLHPNDENIARKAILEALSAFRKNNGINYRPRKFRHSRYHGVE